MHNDYVRPDGQWLGIWDLSPLDMQRLDDAQSKLINGDAGGTWNPTSPIHLGNANVTLTGTGHLVLGGVQTKNTGRIYLGHNDWPTFLTAQTRAVVVPLWNARKDLQDAWEIDTSLDPSGIKSTFPGATVQWTIPQRYLHNGATLVAVGLTFHVDQPHLLLPTQPQFTIYRVSPGAPASVSSLGTVTQPTAASVDAYYSNGVAQMFTLSTSGARVIDVSQYGYAVQIVDESGGNALAGNVYTSLTLYYNTINDLRFE